MLSVALALAASVTWGISDFIGGLNSRRLPLTMVLLISQTVGAVLLLPIAALHAPLSLEAPQLAYAAAGSISGLVGIAGLYRGMAVGLVSIVAPISGTGAVIPVAFGLLRGERINALQAAGVVLALVGVVLASRAADDPAAAKSARLANGVGFAVLGALGFGGFFVLLHEAAVGDVLWASAIQRLTGVGITLAIVLLRQTPMRVSRNRLAPLIVVGAMDTSANVLYGFASVSGLVSLAAMLASLYPVATVVLARIVLSERMSSAQTSGVVCTLVGVACISLQ